MEYPAKFVRLSDGDYMVTFRDFPAMECKMRRESGGQREISSEEITELGQSILSMCIKEHMRRNMEIPYPSKPIDDEILISVIFMGDPDGMIRTEYYPKEKL